jgi:4-hydroxybutyrate CoA-transferase
MPQWIDAAALPGLLRPGITVALTGALNEPRALTAELHARPEASRGVRYVATLLPGLPAFAPPADSRLRTFFMAPELEQADREGRIDLVPMHYRDAWDDLYELDADLVLTQVAPPDREGRCSLGLAVDFLPALLEGARTVVAEINSALPSPRGALSIPFERIDLAVRVDRPFPAQAPSTSETARAIGRHVTTLVDDGACLQTGVGAIPAAVLGSLREKNDLGLHSGMLTDEIRDLVAAGVLTGAAKTRDRGRHVSGVVFGTEPLYEWATACPELDLRPVSYTHDLRVIAELDRFIAINSALEVDLFGQVNAEMVDGRQVSGSGGAVDFLRGAARSRGGSGIVALPATARAGAVSRIVPALAAGTVATAPRTDVDYVVTEHGVAHLRGRSVDERAQALVAIADPRFRDALSDARRALGRGRGAPQP